MRGLQLTDAISRLVVEEPVYAHKFTGTRYDCGCKLGYLEATIAYALKHPEVGSQFSEIINRVSDTYLQQKLSD